MSDDKVIQKYTEEYLQWMAAHGYAKTTLNNYGKALHRFKILVDQKKGTIENSFTHRTLRRFRQAYPTTRTAAIRGLSIYLY